MQIKTIIFYSVRASKDIEMNELIVAKFFSAVAVG